MDASTFSVSAKTGAHSQYEDIMKLLSEGSYMFTFATDFSISISDEPLRKRFHPRKIQNVSRFI